MTWPYDDPEDLIAALEGPTWDCPGGICECHPPSGTEETRTVSIALRDDAGEGMAGALCRLWYSGRLLLPDLVADGGGWVQADIPTEARVVFLEWAPPSLPRGNGYPVRRHYIVTLREDNRRERARQRLFNLGYDQGTTLARNVSIFEYDHEFDPPTGDWRRIERQLADYHDLGITPEPTVASSESDDGPTFTFFDSPAGDPGISPGGDPSVPSQAGSASFKRDFPTPKEAHAQNKFWHEFEAINIDIDDSSSRRWVILLLVSHDAFKWEAPTGTAAGSEGDFWRRNFPDLTNPDPFVPSSMNNRRVVRLPSTAEDAQAFADDFEFSVAGLQALTKLSDLEDDIHPPPSDDRQLPCLLPTPKIMDERWDLPKKATMATHPDGGTTVVVKTIQQSRQVNNTINGRHVSSDVMVGNPGKVWTIHNKMFINPTAATPVRKKKRGHPVAVNYGWHGPPATKTSVTGRFKVIQTPQTGHHIKYKDYSQVVILVAGWCAIFSPYRGSWAWEPTENLYRNEGNIKHLNSTHSVELHRTISKDDLITHKY